MIDNADNRSQTLLASLVEEHPKNDCIIMSLHSTIMNNSYMTVRPPSFHVKQVVYMRLVNSTDCCMWRTFTSLCEIVY